MLKRIRIVLIILVFLAITIFWNSTVNAAGNVSLASSKQSGYVGDEFYVSVNLSDISVATLTVRISIDPSKVEYISGPGNSNYINGKVIYTWTDQTGGLSPLTSRKYRKFQI